MKTQFDWRKRVVALSNLKAMCERVSGVCHAYQVTKVTTNRVHVEYSNPDVYGNPNPMTAVFPCYPCDAWDKEARAVVLDILRVINDSWDCEGWQSFGVLMDCPELSRRNSDTEEWKTRDEWLEGTRTAARLAEIQTDVKAAIAETLSRLGVTAKNPDYVSDTLSGEIAADVAERCRMLIS